MSYFYKNIAGEKSNRLDYARESALDYSGYDDIKTGQTTNNYQYNKLGELTYDVSEGMQMIWRYGDHKLDSIERFDEDSPNLKFVYNPLGIRVAKIEKPRSSGVLSPKSDWIVTYYAYDANGQLMATYDSELYNGETKTTTLEEQYIYGSKRVGVIKKGLTVFYQVPAEPSSSPIVEHNLGQRSYEMSNHLGNVLATITDRKVYNSTDQVYEPVITMFADYFSFGSVMPNRNSNTSSSRFMFNGMEADGEISGDGNSYTTEFRQYDPRLGRWKSRDPLESSFPWQSPYVAFDNNPIFYTDPLGLAAEGGDGDGLPENPDEGDTHVNDEGESFTATLGENKKIEWTKDAVQVFDEVAVGAVGQPETNNNATATGSGTNSPSLTGVYARFIINSIYSNPEMYDFLTYFDNDLYNRGSDGNRKKNNDQVAGGTNYVGPNGNNDQAIKGGVGTDRQTKGYLPGEFGNSRGVRYRKYRWERGGSLRDFNNKVQSGKSVYDAGKTIVEQMPLKKKTSNSVKRDVAEAQEVVMVDSGEKFDTEGVRYYYEAFSNGVTRYYKEGEKSGNFTPHIWITKKEYENVK